MSANAGPDIVEDGIVFYYDTGNTVKSYIGEPTTNVMAQSNNVTGSNYGYNSEYEPCQLTKVWYPNIQTPIGTGATLLTQQNVSSIWHCLNWFDDSEDGKRCLSAYIYPLTTGITNFTLGMVGDAGNSVIFNLDTGATTVGAGLANANAFYTPVPNYPGWYRIGANIEGRVGGWVASIGLGQTGTYTPSTPYKSFYICGIQYERNIATHCTQFTPAGTTRSATQGLLDMARTSTINITNASFDNNAQIEFDGTNDYTDSGYDLSWNNTNSVSVEFMVKPYNVSGGNYGIIGKEYPNWEWAFYQSNTTLNLVYWNNAGGHSNGMDFQVNVFPTANTWYHVIYTWDTTTSIFYVNGTAAGSKVAVDPSINQNRSNNVMIGGHTYVWADSYFNGKLDLVKFYNKALTASEVQTNFNALRTRFGI